MIVHCHGKTLLGLFLADDVLIKSLFDLDRGESGFGTAPGGKRGEIVPDDINRARDTDVTDVHIGSGDDALHFLGGSPAE